MKHLPKNGRARPGAAMNPPARTARNGLKQRIRSLMTRLIHQPATKARDGRKSRDDGRNQRPRVAFSGWRWLLKSGIGSSYLTAQHSDMSVLLWVGLGLLAFGLLQAAYQWWRKEQEARAPIATRPRPPRHAWNPKLPRQSEATTSGGGYSWLRLLLDYFGKQDSDDG